ncbi:MAG: 5'/3'-nucleotidase SurE [Bacillota bacterium]|nr:5'/3'-nucleotidase SurE [Bacillota bacterium]
MRILITNDDGLHSAGLAIVAERLADIAELYIAAPLSERSGSGHGLTVHTPLRAYRRPLPGICERAWAVDGYPADCVKLAFEQLMPEPADIVVSGINHGGNLGTDIIYSGTVAGALEGYLYGASAIAVSETGMRRERGSGNFTYAAELVREICLDWQAAGFEPHQIWNINVPGSVPQDIKGRKFTYMGRRWYSKAYDVREDPNGRPYYWLCGSVDDSACGAGSDIEACNSGYVSLTPLDGDLTNYQRLEQLKGV